MPRDIKGVSKRMSKVFDTRRYFVIASEGADTERIYFEGLQNQIAKQGILDRLIKIEFLKRASEKHRSESSHKKVLEQLNRYKKTYQLDEKDELWLVIDRDRQNNPIKNISNVAQSCQQKGYFLALSNPKFEIWLLLHLKDIVEYDIEKLEQFLSNKKISASKSALDFELAKLLGSYDKSNYSTDKLLPFILDAIQRAKSLDQNQEDRWIEHGLGTRVYRLIENILDMKG